MSLLLRVLGCSVLLAGLAAAQDVRARIELESGRVLRVPVVRIDAEQLVIRLDGVEMPIPTASVRSIEMVSDASDDASREAQLARVRAALGEPVPPEPAPSAPPVGRTDHPPSPAPAVETAAAPASRPDEVPRGPDARIVHLLDRYLWLIPAGPGHLTSIGAALLALFTGLVIWSARLASIEHVNLGRGFGVAVAMLVVFAVEASVLPALPTFLVAAAVVDLVALFTLSILVLRADAVGAAWMVLCFTLNLLVAVMVVELVGVLMQPANLTAT